MKTLTMREAISPVIATVIIVAVAIAISIAVAGWLMGLWGGFGQTESLKIFPDSYATTDANGNGWLVLHLQNVGGSPAQIYKIEVSGAVADAAAANVTVYVDTNPIDPATPPGTADSIPITIDPGEEVYIAVKFDNTAATNKFEPSAGVAYTVTIYTEAGNVYTTTVYGK